MSWIQSPQMLLQEVEAWRSSREGAAQRTRESTRLENAERKLQGQIERLVDAYQAGAMPVEELKARRERLDAEKQAVRARIEELDAQDQDRARVDRLADDLEAFAATLREGLHKLDFPGRQRPVQLLIERIVVTGDHVAIEHAIPLSGRFSALRPQDRRADLPSLLRKAARDGDHHRRDDDPQDPRAPPSKGRPAASRTGPRSHVGADRPRLRGGVGELAGGRVGGAEAKVRAV